VKKLIISIIGTLSSLAFSSNVFAALPEPEPAAAPAAQCSITFGTGPAGKGYSKMYANFHTMCPQIPTCEQTSEGALDNLDLLISKKADVALTGAFTLSNMLGGDEQYKQIQVVSSLHSNLVHILTMSNGFTTPGAMVAGAPVKNPKYSQFNPLSKEPEMIPGPMVAGPANRVEINKFTDLKGRPVGLVGSAQFIARKLDKTAGHNMAFTDYENDQKAMADLKAGKIYAVLTVAAWPHGVIDKLKSDSGYKLVNYDLQPTAPLSVVKKAYKGLGQFNVELLAEPNLLVTRPFSAGGENAKLVAAIKSCLVTNIGKFKDGKFEAAWNEVNDMGQTYNLPAFNAPGASGAKTVVKKP
jgi:TRAP-type uncharacterized transport system substrate-binding protein